MATEAGPILCQHCGHRFLDHEPFVDALTPQKCLKCDTCPGWIHIAAAAGRAKGQSGSGPKKAG